MAADVRDVLEALRAPRPGRPRHEALWRIENREEVVAALQAVRRTGPGRLRTVALDALVHLAGPAALDPTDLAAIDRLIRVRQRTDPIAAVVSCWTYWWCVRSDDQSAVMTSLGLTGARPVTYNLACSVIGILEHDQRDSAASAHPSTAGRRWSGRAVTRSANTEPTCRRCWSGSASSTARRTRSTSARRATGPPGSWSATLQQH